MIRFARHIVVLAVAALGFAALPAQAAVRIRIDLAAQRLQASMPDGDALTFKISSGRRGYETPSGHYEVYRMEADHFSDEYDQAPMPFAMFFSPRGLAIHGSYERSLGRPASHGCVRLSVSNAKQLFGLVEKHGGAVVDIVGLAHAPLARKQRGREALRVSAARRRPAFEALTPETGALESVSRY